MADLVPAIVAEIDNLETELRSDPRFVKLTKLRELQHLYGDEEIEESVAQLPAPKKRGRKPKAKKSPRKAKDAKPAKNVRAPTPKRAVKDRTPYGADLSDAVIAAIRQLQGDNEKPGGAAVAQIVGCSAGKAAKTIGLLIKSGRIVPQGSSQQRTYLVNRGKVEQQPSQPEEIADVEQDVDEEAVVAEAPPHSERKAVAVPSSYDLDQFGRADREVLLACLSAGDWTSIETITAYADVPGDRVPLVLTKLNAAGLTSHANGLWSLTEFGHGVAIAIRAKGRS